MLYGIDTLVSQVVAVSVPRSTSSTRSAPASPARTPVSAMKRISASSRRERKSLPLHAAVNATNWACVSGLTTVVSRLGDFKPTSGVLTLLALLSGPCREPANGELAGPSSGGGGTLVEQFRDEGIHCGSCEKHGKLLLLAKRDVRSDTIAVDLDCCRALAFRPQMQPPTGKEADDISVCRSFAHITILTESAVQVQAQRRSCQSPDAARVPVVFAKRAQSR